MLLDGKGSAALDANNDADFRKIYDSTFTLLFKVAVKIVLEEEAAEDIVHDSFIKAMENHMVFPTMNCISSAASDVYKRQKWIFSKRKQGKLPSRR